MSNYWKIQGIPHKGWVLEDVYDIREDGQSIDETDYETCMMCNNERIRYVHVVTHKEVEEEFKVGCVCAEKMTNDYVNPKQIENNLRNKANRRINWVKKAWKISKNGNHYLKVEEHHLLIYIDKKINKYKCKIDEQFGKKSFENIEQAKIAIFNGIEYYKEKGEW
jgi:hypothetical protein